MTKTVRITLDVVVSEYPDRDWEGYSLDEEYEKPMPSDYSARDIGLLFEDFEKEALLEGADVFLCIDKISLVSAADVIASD